MNILANLAFYSADQYLDVKFGTLLEGCAHSHMSTFYFVLECHLIVSVLVPHNVIGPILVDRINHQEDALCR